MKRVAFARWTFFAATALLVMGLGLKTGEPRSAASAGTHRTRIVAVYPTADVLPENQLKLYLYFSGPMGWASPWPYVRLLDEEGREQHDVFHTAAELWDPERRRLTLLFDPGRIKRGLANHQALGPPLVRGRRYRLVVSADWPDAAGEPLLEPLEKRFEAGPPDRSRPDVAAWSLSPPRAATREPLVVDLGEPLDHALLARSLAVLRLGRSPTPVKGEAVTRSGETRWELTPSKPWRAGRYALRVNPLIEDLAGNNLERLFDTDLQAPPSADSLITHSRTFDVEPKT